MTDEANAHTKAVVERFTEISGAIAVGVAEQPEVRNVRKPDRALARQHARGEAVQRRVETVGKNRGMIRLAVPVAIFDQADALAVFGIPGEALAQMPLHLGYTIIHRARGPLDH